MILKIAVALLRHAVLLPAIWQGHILIAVRVETLALDAHDEYDEVIKCVFFYF